MKNISRQAGFSLIELVTSLSIISILTALFLANYHTINQRTDLVMTAQTMVSDIRIAQSNALGLVKYNEEMFQGGWGVFFTTSSYIIAADVEPNQALPGGENFLNYPLKKVNFPEKISVDSIYLPNGTQVSTATIVFIPPDPLTYIRTEQGTTTSLNIRLKESVNNTTKTIRINFLGLIEVID